MSDIDTGTLLAGKYRLESLIGRGGMGSVWRAQHLGLGAPVAIKLLDLFSLGGSVDALNRFHREARAAATIRSPHVVQIFDHGVDETLQVPFIVMELMDGESLAQRLARRGAIDPGETARVLTQVTRALTRAHEAGIVHRDLKPDNIFLVRNEDEEVAKVLDFGIAKAQAHALGQDSATRTGAVMGTAYYMSPEQISGSKTLDFRTDLWAFGVMACECLTGKRPFEADSIGGITLKICVEPIPAPSSLGRVPPGFDAWFFKIVSRDPAQRFASAREAAETLRQVCGAPVASLPIRSDAGAPVQASTATEGTLARSVVDGESAGPPLHKRSAALWLVGGALLVALAGGLWRANSGAATPTPTNGSEPPAMPTAVTSSAPAAAPPNLAADPAGSPSPPPQTSAAPVQAERAVVPARPGPAVSKAPESKASKTSPAAAPIAAPATVAKPAEPSKASKPAPTSRDLLDSR